MVRREKILLSVNEEKLPVPDNYSPSTRLIDVLRCETRFKGPKVGCGEGGCGACTVIVDRLDPATGAVTHVTLNSCLATIGSLDGAAVTTAEGLGNSKTGFNAAQEALAKRFGSQCGYCSPGMVVAMTAAAAAAAGSSGVDQSHAAGIARGLDGNLCRCTGWRPIIDACRDVADVEDLHKKSCGGAAATTSQTSCSSSSSTCRSSVGLSAPETSFPDWLKQYVITKHSLQQQQQQQQLMRPSCSSCDQIWVKPSSLSDVAAAVSAAAAQGYSPRLLAGNTGCGVYPALWPHHDKVVIDLSAVRELHEISHHNNHQQQGVVIGAGVTIQQLIHLLRSPAAAAAAQGCDQQIGSQGGVQCPVHQNGSSNISCIGLSRDDYQCSAKGGCAGGDVNGVVAGAAAGVSPCTTKAVWGAVADHLERIAGVHVRSAATLGGHFGLCARKPLPSDLALLLAAAGAQLQIMTIRGAAAAGLLQDGCSSSHLGWQQQQHQQGNWGWQHQQGWQQQCNLEQQQLQYDVRWVSVEDYLSHSCVGSNSSSSSTCDITADSVAGARMVDVASEGQQQQQPWGDMTNSSSSSSKRAGDIPHVVTAVWLPYGDDSSEQFWSYKVALRHVNSHALANAALWIKFDQSTTGLTDYGSSSGGEGEQQQIMTQADRMFAGARILSARLFVGCPPVAGSTAPAAARSSVSSSSSGKDGEPWQITRVRKVEQVLCGKPLDLQAIISALRQLEDHLTTTANLPPTDFHSQTLQGILYKALVPLLPNPNPSPGQITQNSDSLNPPSLSNPSNPGSNPAILNPRVQRLLMLPKPYDPRILPEGRQVLPGFGEQSSDVAPVHLPVEKDAVRLQCSGEAVFAADVAAGMTGRLLYLAGVKSTCALANISAVDMSGTAAVAGVVGVITAADIPGDNKAFTEPLLADGKVEYVGQLIALVAATSQAAADQAAAAVRVTYTPIPDHKPVITIDDAIAAGSFHADFPQLHAAAVRRERLAAHGLCLPTYTTTSSSSSSSDTDDTYSSTDPMNASHHSSISGDVARELDKQTARSLVHQIIASSPRQITNGSYSLPAQQHMYMETQTAVAEPLEDGAVRVTSSTQSLDAVQQVVAGVLNIPFNKVTVVAKRLGGGFGGKASRSMPVAAAAALAAAHFGRPVCYTLNRNDDLLMNHGRCLGRVEYDVGFDDTGKVHAIKAKVIFRAGAYADLSMNDGGTLVAAIDSAYDLSGLSVDVKYARCNIPPHTIVRAPGFLQGVMVLEQVMEHVAAVLGMDSAAVKAANFLPDVSTTTCSTTNISSNMGRLCVASPAAADLKQQQHQQKHVDPEQQQKWQPGVTTVLGRFISSDTYTLPLLWQQLLSSSQYNDRLAAVQQYNCDHAWSKKGIVVTPVRFDCAPAAVSAAVSIYADGSVLVTHGGIEMGQGLTTKVKQVAVAALSQLLPEEQRPLPLELVRVAASSSDVVPNGGPTWSSTGSEGNCQAVMNAGAKLVKQLKSFVKVHGDGLSTWKATIAALYPDTVGFVPSNAMLSAYGYFDGNIGRGRSKQPVQYSAFGAAVTEVELDVLTGERRVLSTHIKYDCGYPLNPAIDLGQIEGGFVMGLGAMLSEEVTTHEETGDTLSASTWKYKIPTMDLIPQQFTVEFGDWPNPRGIMSSKASGEPAVMASTSALMALQQAVTAAVQELQGLQPGAKCAEGSQVVGDTSGFSVLTAPATPPKLKGTVGAFRLADALEAALLGC